MKINNQTIMAQHDLLVKKELSVEELTLQTFSDIRAREDKLNAFITLNEARALEQARTLDKKGVDPSNLTEGIPVALKDNIVTKGLTTTAASKILGKWQPPYNATVAEKLSSAGMILMGKTNLDEFAMGSSGEMSGKGLTRNAWDLTKVPGGSSSGSATAVAGGELRLTLGSDTGGSIRQPAAFSGIVGMKPTYGRVSRFGLIAFASSLDQIGPLSPTVEENAHLLSAISGFDKNDNTSSKENVPDFSASVGKSIQGLRIALPKEYFGQGIDEAVKNQILSAAKTLEKMGAVIDEVSLPHSKYGVAVYYVIASSEASSNLQRFDGIRYGFRASDIQNLEDVYVKTRSQGFGDEVKRRIMLGSFSLSAGYYDAYFKKAGQVRSLIIEDFKNVFENYDLILGPTTPSPAFDIGGKVHDPLALYLADILTIPANLAGLPALSVPAGFVGGLPIGLQLIGKRYDEELLYQVGSVFEAETQFKEQRSKIAEVG